MSAPAVELSSFYYDDPKMRPIAYNLAMKSALWVAMQATEKAYRQWHTSEGIVAQAQEVKGCTPQADGVFGGDMAGKPTDRKNGKRGRLCAVVKGLVFGVFVLVAQKKIAK